MKPSQELATIADTLQVFSVPFDVQIMAPDEIRSLAVALKDVSRRVEALEREAFGSRRMHGGLSACDTSNVISLFDPADCPTPPTPVKKSA